jgi:hypothetical protein
MKFNIGDHLQEIGSIANGRVKEFMKEKASPKPIDFNCDVTNSNDVNWYLIENDELELVNHWLPEYKLELHKQPLRDKKLNELGI